MLGYRYGAPDTFPKASVHVDVESDEVDDDVKSSDVEDDVKSIDFGLRFQDYDEYISLLQNKWSD